MDSPGCGDLARRPAERRPDSRQFRDQFFDGSSSYLVGISAEPSGAKFQPHHRTPGNPHPEGSRNGRAGPPGHSTARKRRRGFDHARSDFFDGCDTAAFDRSSVHRGNNAVQYNRTGRRSAEFHSGAADHRTPADSHPESSRNGGAGSPGYGSTRGHVRQQSAFFSRGKHRSDAAGNDDPIDRSSCNDPAAATAG